MKSLIYSAIIFSLVIAVICTGNYMATSRCEHLVGIGCKLMDDLRAEDYISADSHAQMSIDYLDKNHKWLASIAHHTEIEDIQSGYYRIQQYIYDRDISNAKAEMVRVDSLLDHFIDSEKVKVENIF